eukprot:6202562-Pleurochrysis_carterae.AAC.3
MHAPPVSKRVCDARTDGECTDSTARTAFGVTPEKRAGSPSSAAMARTHSIGLIGGAPAGRVIARVRATSSGVASDCALTAETAPPTADSTAESFAPPFAARTRFLSSSYSTNLMESTGYAYA